MIDLVQDTVEAFELPTGMCLTVRPSTGGAVGTISLLSGAVTLPAVSTPAGSGSATVGPFTVPCRVAVGARGTVSVEVTNAAVQSLVSGAGNRQRPRIGLCGTSITHTLPYRSAISAVNNGDGTWTITFASATRQEFGIAETVMVSQGPEGLNTRSAAVIDNTGNGGLDLVVRPDTALSLPLIGAAPLVYYSHSRNFGAYPIFVEYMAKCAPLVTVDAALGGADTAQLLPLIDRDLAPKSDQFEVVIAEIGTMNGIYARGNSYDTEWALVQQYVAKIAAIGKPWLIVGCCPRSSASGAWTLAKAKIAARINASTAALVRSLGGAFIDPATASYKAKTYIDPSSADGGPRVTEATTDGVHPNSGGGLVLAAPIAQWMDARFAAVDFLPASVIDTDSNMLAPNPLMQGTAGTRTGGAGASVTGTVVTGCDVAVEAGDANTTVLCSVVQRTEGVHGDSLGNVQRLVITTGGGIASVIVRLDLTASAHASLANGDMVEAMCAVTTSNGGTPGSGAPVGLASTNIGVIAQTATTINRFIGGNGSGTAALNQEPYTLRPSSPVAAVRGPLAVHGAPTKVQPRVSIYLRANASVCIDIGRVGFFKR